MTSIARYAASLATLLLVGLTACVFTAPTAAIELRPIGQYDTGRFDESAAEIVAHDAATQRLFLINGERPILDVLDIAQPWNPVLAFTIDLSGLGAGANSVAVQNGVVAVAVEPDNSQAAGRVAFFDTDGELLSSVTVGALPDMVTFTPDGTKVLVANEGEPADYCEAGLEADPEGSVSVIDLSGGVTSLTDAVVTTAGFQAFNTGAPDGVRIFGPGASVAQDLEPEYIAVSADSSTAWISLQENNALAVLDIATATITDLLPLGTKDHSLPENAFDASNRDGLRRIVPWPTQGMYQPDAIAGLTSGGTTYILTANEGDARDYDCFSEEIRGDDLELDPAVFPDATTLLEDENLGRLRTTSASGDADGDGLHETFFSYGARSFSVWSADGELVWDSGRDFELITAARVPEHFNSNGPGEDVDDRSDDKGPEPEGITLGFFRGRTYAFIGLERTGGIMVYDLTEPQRPSFVQYVTNLKPDGTPVAGDVVDQAPEGLLFIPKAQSPIARALLVVAHEVSGTITLFSVLPSTAP